MPFLVGHIPDEMRTCNEHESPGDCTGQMLSTAIAAGGFGASIESIVA